MGRDCGDYGFVPSAVFLLRFLPNLGRLVAGFPIGFELSEVLHPKELPPRSVFKL